MLEEKRTDNVEIIENKENKEDRKDFSLTNTITKAVSHIIEAVKQIFTLFMAIIILLISLLIVTSPITITYFLYFKNKEWKVERDMCRSYINNGLYERAIEYADTIKDHYKLPSTYFCIGIAYYNTGNLQMALQNFKKAEEMEESILYGTIHGSGDLANIYAYITKTLCKLEKHNEAEEYYKKLLDTKKCLDVVDRDNDYGNEYANIIKGIAEACEEKGSLDNAIKYYQDALIFYCDRCYKEKIEIYRKLSELYKKKGNESQAERYLNMASELEQEANQEANQRNQ